jgi:ribosomal-protein-alanine N-acetyltransferase
MNRLQLRPLTEDLLSEAVQLDRLALGGLWSEDGYQREIHSPNSDLLCLQQCVTHPSQAPNLDIPENNRPQLVGIACVWAILEEAHITVLATHPDYRRQGLAQTLLWSMLALAHQRQLEWATLEVRPSNAAAIALYQHFGFQEVGRRKKYYADTGEDALILWRKGLHHAEFQEQLQTWALQVGDRLTTAGWMLTIEQLPLNPTLMGFT